MLRILLRKVSLKKYHNVYFSSTSKSNSEKYDLIIVGGGIIGTATAREVLKGNPSLKAAIVEKEPKLAAHQSGHNSGVIHAGIYYKPGSLKAQLCVSGLNLAYKYLDEKGIPYKKCGKLIVATNRLELERLGDLYERGTLNNVKDLQLVEGDRIREIEPYCRGLKAIWSPHTGIVDWGLVTQHYGDDFRKAGGEIHLNYEVVDFKVSSDPDYPILIPSRNGKTVESKYVLTCGGLHSDKLSEMSGCSRSPRIVPFRGEYLLLNPEKCHMIKGNIYPVPDPRFPFLGVHFTPRIDGSVWLGPNAVLAFKREGYTWSDINVPELLDSITYGGFRKLATKYMLYGLGEVAKSACLSMQIKELQKFVPDITVSDISRGPAGVRAQALDDDGNLVDDFYFDKGIGDLSKRILHCRNAPSPGATSSLSIAQMIAKKLNEDFQLGLQPKA